MTYQIAATPMTLSDSLQVCIFVQSWHAAADRVQLIDSIERCELLVQHYTVFQKKTATLFFGHNFC